MVAHGLSRAFNKATERPRQREATTPVTACANQLNSTLSSVYVNVMVVNFSHEEIELPKVTVLGLAEETSASIIAAINDEKLPNVSQNGKIPRGDNTVVKDTWFQEYLRDRLGHLNHEERSVLEPVLVKYRQVFHRERSNEFQGTNLAEHKIITDTRDRYVNLLAEYHLPSERKWIIRYRTCPVRVSWGQREYG